MGSDESCGPVPRIPVVYLLTRVKMCFVTLFASWPNVTDNGWFTAQFQGSDRDDGEPGSVLALPT